MVVHGGELGRRELSQEGICGSGDGGDWYLFILELE